MSLLRVWIDRWRRRRQHARQFRMEAGASSQGRWLPHTRISPSTCIEREDRLELGDHVTIGHFNLIEASAGVVIEEGVHISSHVAIVSCSSHRSRRLLGRAFATWPRGMAPSLDAVPMPAADADGSPPPARTPPGWIEGPVHIGAYSFIGPHSLIEAGTRLGRGCIVCAGAQVRGDFVDFSIIEGAPARVIGDSRRADQPWLQQHPELLELYAQWAGPESVER